MKKGPRQKVFQHWFQQPKNARKILAQMYIMYIIVGMSYEDRETSR